MPTKDVSIYQIKITLLGTKPPIWRRVLVPTAFTLEQLHEVIQSVMGWYGMHLHVFNCGGEEYGEPSREASDMGMPVIDQRKVRVGQVLTRAGSKVVYTYDFGDDWQHSVKVEKTLPADPAMEYPVCVAGELNGPPEDCGGVWGFYELVEAIHDPQHKQHKELLDWVGEDYDPETFSVDAANARLQWMRKKPKVRSAHHGS